MKIKRTGLNFHNVISARAMCKENEWYETARDLRNAVIRNGLYGTGPVIYQIQPKDEGAEATEYIFHLPVNEPVDMKENEQYSFIEQLNYDDGLVIRHADMDEDIEDSYELLRASAEAFGLELQEPYYHIYLDVYGDEGIIDIYAPIVKETSHGKSL